MLMVMSLEICNLSNDIHDYYFVSQGKTTIPSMDDGEECTLTDVSAVHEGLHVLLKTRFFSANWEQYVTQPIGFGNVVFKLFFIRKLLAILCSLRNTLSQRPERALAFFFHFS